MIKKIVAIFGIVIFGMILSGCKSPEKQEGQLPEKRINPNLDERAKEFAEKGGGIFNSSRSSKSTTYDFATSNVLWRATLATLEFMPLALVDYSGGVISTDWYSTKADSKESIKITVRFLSTDPSSSSVKVISHKKICQAATECSVTEVSSNFEQEIKDKIFNEVRKITIANEIIKK
jgi:hypothetical protein